MPTYNFKKELKLYVVSNNIKHRLNIYSDVNFSQTFNETPVQVKTLHTPYNMFDDAVIKKANPANFNFSLLLDRSTQFAAIFDLILSYDNTSSEVVMKSADYYIEMNTEIFKLEKGVIESAVFQIARNQLITLNCSGTASKLYKVASIPGTASTYSYSTANYTSPNSLEIKLAGQVMDNVSAISLEIKNNVNWIDYATLQNSQNVTNASDTMYPEAFVVPGRTLSGYVQQYVIDTNMGTVNTWKRGDSLSFKMGSTSSTWILSVNIPSVIYTNRSDLQDMLMQSFDFRMVASPLDLNTVVQLI